MQIRFLTLNSKSVKIEENILFFFGKKMSKFRNIHELDPDSFYNLSLQDPDLQMKLLVYDSGSFFSSSTLINASACGANSTNGKLSIHGSALILGSAT